MATALLTFPTLPSGKVTDSSKLEISRADPAMRHEMEGGYTITRARYTRKPVKRFKVGFTNITNADQVVLDTFWDATRGGSRAFTWRCPTDNLTYNVRFKGEIAFAYRGVGGNHFWDCSMEFEQV